MEHHRIYNNPPLHWGYSSSSHAMHNTWVPPPSRGIKRSISESDCEDNFSETSSKDTSPKDTDADSCQHLSRKKRRGVIEKKRRDRINSSLSELKRLVPSAYEKQGSSKLEKAEILQLTVDHLKSLHAKGIDSMSFDPQRYAMDYHVIGFQECVSEVARYLIAHEGMDIQNPLRMRLLSHLRCFAAQRELSIKSATASTPVAANQSWTPTPSAAYPLSQGGYATAAVAGTLAPPLPPPPPSSSSTSSLLPPLPRSLQTPTTSTITSAGAASSLSVSSGPAATAMYSSSYATSPHASNYPYVPNLAPTGSSSDLFTEPHTPTSTHPSNDTLSVELQQHLPHNHQNQHNNHYIQHQDQNGTTYTDLSSSAQRNTVVSIGYSNQYLPNSMTGFGHHSTSEHDSDPLSAGYNSNNKPYRPWGGPEMAY